MLAGRQMGCPRLRTEPQLDRRHRFGRTGEERGIERLHRGGRSESPDRLVADGRGISGRLPGAGAGLGLVRQAARAHHLRSNPQEQRRALRLRDSTSSHWRHLRFLLSGAGMAGNLDDLRGHPPRSENGPSNGVSLSTRRDTGVSYQCGEEGQGNEGKNTAGGLYRRFFASRRSLADGRCRAMKRRRGDSRRGTHVCVRHGG